MSKPTSVEYKEKDVANSMRNEARVQAAMAVRDQVERLWFNWLFDKAAPDYEKRYAARNKLMADFDALFNITRDDQLRDVRREAVMRDAVVLTKEEIEHFTKTGSFPRHVNAVHAGVVLKRKAKRRGK